ncbi:hypothetical protein FB558_0170 [Pseudonocardia kunmingensis]|uniref:Uncharacterized protein n=1 Tax=Pseudonocardia kunmingensis TaxID=630975 RepID=A0A543DVR2_9PSEU|nr:hypothetical protein FB558_0170 [Pseudonocardia kunmingensis]
MTEAPPDSPGTRVRIGVLADPGVPTQLAEWLVDELPASLRSAVSDEFDWVMTSRCEPILLDEDGRIPITELAARHRRAREWDLVLLLTDLPRRSGARPVAAEFDLDARAGVVSVPALGAVGQRRRARGLALRLVRKLTEPGREPTECAIPPATGTPRPSRDASAAGPAARGIDGELAMAALPGRLRLLNGMVRANRPWRLVPQLSSATAAAVATAAYAIVTASFWEMSASLSASRLMLINLLAVGAMTVWIIAYNRLWERPPDPTDRAKSALYNASTLLTILIGVACMNVLLFTVMLVAAAALIDPGYLADTLRRPVGPGGYLKLVWLGSSIGIVAGALGSSLESEDAVREATYGARERERRRAKRDEAER